IALDPPYGGSHCRLKEVRRDRDSSPRGDRNVREPDRNRDAEEQDERIQRRPPRLRAVGVWAERRRVVVRPCGLAPEEEAPSPAPPGGVVPRGRGPPYPTDARVSSPVAGTAPFKRTKVCCDVAAPPQRSRNGELGHVRELRPEPGKRTAREDHGDPDEARMQTRLGPLGFRLGLWREVEAEREKRGVLADEREGAPRTADAP